MNYLNKACYQNNYHNARPSKLSMITPFSVSATKYLEEEYLTENYLDEPTYGETLKALSPQSLSRKPSQRSPESAEKSTECELSPTTNFSYKDDFSPYSHSEQSVEAFDPKKFDTITHQTVGEFMDSRSDSDPQSPSSSTYTVTKKNKYEPPTPIEGSILRHKNWDETDDQDLLKFVVKYKNDWKKVADRFKTRKKKVTNHFLKTRYKELTNDPYLLRRKFSYEEDLLIAKYYVEYGCDWERISQHFSNRTGTMIKNRFYSYIKKKDLLEQLLQELEQRTTTPHDPSPQAFSSEEEELTYYTPTKQIKNLEAEQFNQTILEEYTASLEDQLQTYITPSHSARHTAHVSEFICQCPTKSSSNFDGSISQKDVPARGQNMESLKIAEMELFFSTIEKNLINSRWSNSTSQLSALDGKLIYLNQNYHHL